MVSHNELHHTHLAADGFQAIVVQCIITQVTRSARKKVTTVAFGNVLSFVVLTAFIYRTLLVGAARFKCFKMNVCYVRCAQLRSLAM